jgi:short-subunit dehydrogenase
MPVMLIVGATSAIAQSAASAFGRKGWDIQLAGRDVGRIAKVADNLSACLGRTVEYFRFDALDAENRQSFWTALPKAPDALLCAVGVLGDMRTARDDMRQAEEITIVNYSGLLPLLSQAAATFEARGSGLIIGISSVAGDRGRASNYTYGAAKAALTTYLSGLRQRLEQHGVSVITVKPGYVGTAMTQNIQLPAVITGNPDQVAADIVLAVERKHSIIYTLWYWRLIMVIIKAIPEFIFKRLNL